MEVTARDTLWRQGLWEPSCRYGGVLYGLGEKWQDDQLPDRLFGKGNNPKTRTAVWEYLRRLQKEGRQASDREPLRFEFDKMVESKLLITVAPDGCLKRAGQMLQTYHKQAFLPC